MQIVYFTDISPLVLTIFIIALAWSLAWKGIALWIAAKKGAVAWFVILLIISTVGILDILYVYIFSKRNAGQGRRGAKKQSMRARKPAGRRKRR